MKLSAVSATLLLTFAASSLALVTGCSGGSTPTPAPGVTSGTPAKAGDDSFDFKCSVSAIAGKSLAYVVNGNQLTVTDPSSTAIPASILTQTDTANGARPVYGSWKLPAVTTGPTDADTRFMQAHDVKFVVTMTLEEGFITFTNDCSSKHGSLQAKARSSATITDTLITVGEGDDDVKEERFTLAKGDLQLASVKPLASEAAPSIAGGSLFDATWDAEIVAPE